MPRGTASKAKSSDSRNRPQPLHRIATATARPAAGSIQCQPVTSTAAPAATTTNDTPASAAICKNAPRALTSARRARKNNAAENALTRNAKPATAMIHTPSTGCGSRKRCTLSQINTPHAASSSAALSSAASMVERAMP